MIVEQLLVELAIGRVVFERELALRRGPLARRHRQRTEPELHALGHDRVAQQHRVDRAARLDAVAVRLLDLADRCARRQRRERPLAERFAELAAQPPAALGELEAHAIEPRQSSRIFDRGLAQPAEHDVEHAELHALDRLVVLVEPPRTLRPAQRLDELVPGLAPELIDQLLDGQDLQRDQRLAELAADGRRARDRGVVLVLGDHAAVDEEVAERLVARGRRGAHRVAVDQVDGLRDPATAQRELAGREIFMEIEQDRG